MFNTSTHIVFFQNSESIVHIGHEVNTSVTSFASLKKNEHIKHPISLQLKKSIPLKYRFAGFTKGWAKALSQCLAYPIDNFHDNSI